MKIEPRLLSKPKSNNVEDWCLRTEVTEVSKSKTDITVNVPIGRIGECLFNLRTHDLAVIISSEGNKYFIDRVNPETHGDWIRGDVLWVVHPSSLFTLRDKDNSHLRPVHK